MEHVQDATDHPPIVHPRHATRLVGQQQLQPRPLLIAQPELCLGAALSTAAFNHSRTARERPLEWLDPNPLALALKPELHPAALDAVVRGVLQLAGQPFLKTGARGGIDSDVARPGLLVGK